MREEKQQTSLLLASQDPEKKEGPNRTQQAPLAPPSPTAQSLNIKTSSSLGCFSHLLALLNSITFLLKRINLNLALPALLLLLHLQQQRAVDMR